MNKRQKRKSNRRKQQVQELAIVQQTLARLEHKVACLEQTLEYNGFELFF